MSGNEHVFPQSVYRPSPAAGVAGRVNLEGGLSKRELLAGLAMQGILSNPNPGLKSSRVSTGEPVTAAVVAEIAIECADAVLLGLEERTRS